MAMKRFLTLSIAIALALVTAMPLPAMAACANGKCWGAVGVGPMARGAMHMITRLKTLRLTQCKTIAAATAPPSKPFSTLVAQSPKATMAAGAGHGMSIR